MKRPTIYTDQTPATTTDRTYPEDAEYNRWQDAIRAAVAAERERILRELLAACASLIVCDCGHCDGCRLRPYVNDMVSIVKGTYKAAPGGEVSDEK